jgi:hypothetical protein
VKEWEEVVVGTVTVAISVVRDVTVIVVSFV